MNTKKRITLGWTILMMLLCNTTLVYSQAISLYGGLSFPPSPLKSNAEQELGQPLIIRIVGTNEKGELVPAKDSPVPVREAIDAKTGKFKSELWTHAVNVTWQFTKSGIKFAADGTTYKVNKVGATITFTKTNVEMIGVTKTSTSPVEKKKSSGDRKSVKPTQGKYRTAFDDGGSFQLVLVSTNGTTLVQSVSYSFMATKFAVGDLTTKDGKPFGRDTVTGVEFQFPLLLGLGFGGAESTYYKGDLTFGTRDTVECKLRRLSYADKTLEAPSNFGSAVEVRNSTDVTKLQESYHFVLKKAD